MNDSLRKAKRLVDKIVPGRSSASQSSTEIVIHHAVDIFQSQPYEHTREVAEPTSPVSEPSKEESSKKQAPKEEEAKPVPPKETKSESKPVPPKEAKSEPKKQSESKTSGSGATLGDRGERRVCTPVVLPMQALTHCRSR